MLKSKPCLAKKAKLPDCADVEFGNRSVAFLRIHPSGNTERFETLNVHDIAD